MTNFDKIVPALLVLAFTLLLSPRAEASVTSPTERSTASTPITVCIVPDAGVMYRVAADEDCLEESHERVTIGGAQLKVRDRGSVTISGEDENTKTMSCEPGETALAGHWELTSFSSVEDFIFTGGKPTSDGNGWTLRWIMNGAGATPTANLHLSITCSG